MKYKTIGAFKNVQNVPYCKAASDMKVGMGVILDRVAKTATLPASEDDAKKVAYPALPRTALLAAAYPQCFWNWRKLLGSRRP